MTLGMQTKGPWKRDQSGVQKQRAWVPGLAFTEEGKEGHDTAQIPAHLHIHEELPEVARGQHDGGVKLNDVALVQGDVVVGSETLSRRRHHVRLGRN